MGAGVPEDAITTGPFSVTTHYEWIYEKIEESYSRRHREEYRRVRREVDGYECEGSISVELPMDQGLVREIWSALNDIEGDFGFNFEHQLEHPEVHERALLEQAVAEARERAEVLAVASGVKLGQVEAIKHEYRYARRPGIDINFSKSEMVFEMPGSIGSGGPDDMPALNPENIPLSCSVTLRWGLV